MTAHIIHLADHRPPENPGSNGAREAMVKSLTAVFPYEAGAAPELCDDVLANLWFLGFKIMPVGEAE